MPPRPLECQDIVFRAILRARDIDKETKRPLAAAFRLRKSEPSLSVYYDLQCSKVANQFNKCYGVASLHVGRVKDLGLDVEADDDHHANIIGIPQDDDDLAKAEHLANQLRKQARLVWQP